MYAIIETAGKQYGVHPGDTIEIDRTEGDINQKLQFDQVLAIKDDNNTEIGTPFIEGAQVSGEVIDQLKDKKILVFKMKRRKRYKRRLGHRQLRTKIKILEINKTQASNEGEASE